MWRSVLVMTVGLGIGTAASGQDFEGTAQPADVRVAVEWLANDLEQVRLYMGKPDLTQRRFQVDFAAPRHVFYQAQTLFRKLNRLGTEVSGIARRSPPPAPADDTILPEDVLRVVLLAEEQLALVRESMGLAARSAMPERDPRTEPKDVFEEIVQVNRQVNLMIDDPFRPADVHTQLSLASAYLGGVLAAMGQDPFPQAEFVPNKQPVDVYDRLIDCLVLNQQVGAKLDVPVLQIDARRLKRDRSDLSDNYDIATMLVSDIAFWTETMDHDEDAFPPSESLKHIFPSHVFVKVNVIQQQFDGILGTL